MHTALIKSGDNTKKKSEKSFLSTPQISLFLSFIPHLFLSSPYALTIPRGLVLSSLPPLPISESFTKPCWF